MNRIISASSNSEHQFGIQRQAGRKVSRRLFRSVSLRMAGAVVAAVVAGVVTSSWGSVSVDGGTTFVVTSGTTSNLGTELIIGDTTSFNSLFVTKRTRTYRRSRGARSNTTP